MGIWYWEDNFLVKWVVNIGGICWIIIIGIFKFLGNFCKSWDKVNGFFVEILIIKIFILKDKSWVGIFL